MYDSAVYSYVCVSVDLYVYMLVLVVCCIIQAIHGYTSQRIHSVYSKSTSAFSFKSDFCVPLKTIVQRNAP